MKLLLVEPNFPVPNKSRNHKSVLPIGLLKLASYYMDKDHRVKLVKGTQKLRNFKPDQIMITSLFTYWATYVKDCVKFYKELYPEAKVIVGGVYASLMPEHCKDYTGCDEVFIGIHREAEKYFPAYNLLNPKPEYQIIHTSRGCFRRCPFCGVWKIEPNVTFKKSIRNEICSNKLIFYDNNLLANPNIKNILDEIIAAKRKGKSIICEAQCGIDGRLLTPEIASLLKEAGFPNIRIAWDWHYSKWKDIKTHLDMLAKAGYRSKDIYVFMLYNWEIPFEEMEKKRIKCWEWQVQIADCRFRPVNQTFDNYNPRKKQTNKDYYIHPKWTDAEVKQFRKNVRRQNICVRQELAFYSSTLEHKRKNKKLTLRLRRMPQWKVKRIIKDAWFPDKATYPLSNKSDRGWLLKQIFFPYKHIKSYLKNREPNS